MSCGDEQGAGDAGPHVGIQPYAFAHGYVEAFEVAALQGGARRLNKDLDAPR